MSTADYESSDYVTNRKALKGRTAIIGYTYCNLEENKLKEYCFSCLKCSWKRIEPVDLVAHDIITPIKISRKYNKVN